MASKYDGLSRIIIQNVGGKENIISVAHCVTRLRFKLKDESKAHTDVLMETDGVVTVLQAGGQYQVVIGNHVPDVYDSVLAVGHLTPGGEVDEDGNPIEGGGEGGGKKKPLDILIDTISGTLSPTLGVLGAAGIIKGLLALASFYHWLPTNSGAYMIWNAVGDGFFYFLPVMLGYTCAKKFKFNEFTGMAIGVSLVYPTMVNITSGEILGTLFAGTSMAMNYYTTFLGIPVIMPASGYTSSVVPIILASLVAARFEKWLRKVVPDVIKLFVVPFCVMLVCVPITYLVIGPIATVLCNILAMIITFLFNLPVVGGAVAGLVIGSLWQVLVIFGLHWGVVPLAINNFSLLGFDYILPCNYACSWAQTAAVLAIMLKTKNDKLKKTALPAFISGIFGVTEPAIYGVTLPKKTPFIISCVGAAIGSMVAGALGIVRFQMGGMGLFALPCYIDPDPAGTGLYNMFIIMLCAVIGIVISFIATWVTYHDDPPKAKAAATAGGASAPAAAKAAPAVAAGQTVVISADAKGKVLKMDEVPDPVFNQGVLGQCCGIEPVEGKVYAPVDGVVSNIADSKHAIGFETSSGVEVLIHVGVDTVDMKGDGFAPQVKVGDQVKKGQLVLTMDMAKIKAAGHPATVITVVTNSEDLAKVDLVGSGNVEPGADLFKITT